MGLSSLPAPSSAVLCVLVINTAFCISIFKAVLQSILHVFGIQISSPSPPPPPPPPSIWIENLSESIEFHPDSSCNYAEKFRNLIPVVRFEEALACKFSDHECSVCLTQFEPKSEINHLSCGHLFHKMCLHKWLAYSNSTCPLCRNPLMVEEERLHAFDEGLSDCC